MWVFDGEVWVEEGGETPKREVSEARRPLIGEMPELQIIETPRLREEPRHPGRSRQGTTH